MYSENNKELFFYILDPIYTIIKLALLNFKPKNTKLSIYGNIIDFREDSYYIPHYQSGMRWLFGESRRDLISLHKPIILSIRWLQTLLNNKDSNLIMKLSSSGLLKLSNCYEDEGTLKIIDKYNKILHSFINQKNISHSYFICDDIEELYPKKINNGFISEIWEEKDINTITNIFNLLNDSNDEKIKYNYICNIENILLLKNDLFKKNL
jgi:hypothetical protein